MLKSFSDKFTEDLYHGINTHAIHDHKKMPEGYIQIAHRRLDMLNSAESLEWLKNVPAISAEGPVRDAKGKYSIPIGGTWRVRFRWKDGDAEDVEITS